MAEEQPSLHIDTDWKKQAQEEKRRLAEQAQQRASRQKPAAPAAAPASASPRSAGGRGAREKREASFSGFVQSIMTQAMLYLGELAPQGMEPMLNLDMAKYQNDLLNVLENKTKNNLSPDEQHLIDTALYDLTSRFVSV